MTTQNLSQNRLRPTMLLVLAAFVLLSGCASYVVTDYDRQARFEGFQSYVLVGKSDADADQFQTLDSARIENALRRELGNEGLTAVEDRSDADLLVRYWIEDAKRIESSGFSYGIGLGRNPFGFGVATSPSSREIKEGKLIVELVDADSRQVAWRATSQRNLNERMSPDKRTELIDRVAREMFKKYPPK